MANDADEENQRHIEDHDEETPLLHGEVSNQQQVNQLEPEKKPHSWFLWRILWAVVAVVILTVFIKGWIDAGSDVDVGFMLRRTHDRIHS